MHTLTLSGILLSHERTFELYRETSLRFYAGGKALFPLYTHYLYEKIFRREETPTHALAGEQDRRIPLRAQAKLAAIFPNSRYELLPEAGQVVHLERRDLFFPRLLRFLAARNPEG